MCWLSPEVVGIDGGVWDGDGDENEVGGDWTEFEVLFS